MRIADCGLRILKKAETRDTSVGAAFPARLASESVAGRQPRHHCFNDFNESMNLLIDKWLLDA